MKTADMKPGYRKLVRTLREQKESSAPPTGSAERELAIARQRLNRTVEVEQYLLEAAVGKRPLPDAEKCRELARKIGVPLNAAANAAERSEDRG